MSKRRIENRHLSRRQFLFGSGAMLVLPPLLSLMPERVAAQIAAMSKRRAITWTGLCGIDAHRMFPANQSDLTPFPGAQSVMYKPLSSFTGNPSYMLEAEFSSLYPHMNLMQGLSLTGGSWAGHNDGALAGIHSGEREPRLGKTIDVIMEQSPGVCKPEEGVVPHKAIRLFTTDHDAALSFDRIDGKRINSDHIRGDKALFNKLFAGFGGTTPMGSTDPKMIVDKVYADLQALKNNKRLSSEDRFVLDRYISSVYELQLKVNGSSGGATCQKPTFTLQVTKNGDGGFPADGYGITDTSLMFDNYIEMIKLAFACDLTRVVHIANTIWQDQPTDDSGNFGIHHDVASAVAADRQKWGLKKFLKMGQALAGTQDTFGSGSILDNSIMFFTNELGDWTEGHNIFNMPAVTLGSCGGYFKTGNFIDYRQKPLRELKGYYLGRPYKQVLQSIMSGMGVPKAEYMQFGDGNGFGEFDNRINQFGVVLEKAFEPYKNDHNNELPMFSKNA